MSLEIRVVEHGDSGKDFIRESDGRILLQTSGNRQMYIGFVDVELLPEWPKIPSWYPCEQAIEDAIKRAA